MLLYFFFIFYALQESQGLIPRICKTLFARMAAGKESGASYRTEVSFLEIHNEKVKDLLRLDQGQSHSLRVREHPKRGPYVQDLSSHLVYDYSDIQVIGEIKRAKSMCLHAYKRINTYLIYLAFDYVHSRNAW